jgi:hypothetical protein
MDGDNMEQHEQDLGEVVNAQTLEELNLRVLPCPFFLLERSKRKLKWTPFRLILLRKGIFEVKPALPIVVCQPVWLVREC